MSSPTPLARSAARQLQRPDAAEPGDAHAGPIRLADLAPPPAPPCEPAAVRFAPGAAGAVLRAMSRQSGAPVARLTHGDAGAPTASPPPSDAVARRDDGAAASQEGFPDALHVPISSMRRVIADRLAASKRDAPHYYMSTDCVADALLGMRSDLNASLPADEQLSVNDLLLTLVARCLRDHQALNSAWAGDAIAHFEQVNLAVAVSVEGGLVTPVLRGAERMGLREMHRETQALIDAARRRALPREAFQGGTFTVSNLGMILAVAAAQRRVVALDDERSAVRRVMTLTLSVDHRVADGVAGAEFLQDLKKLIEDPRRAIL
jgi:pyruvate dehydrogenase E2 component (dihydrolipoamide acetyltransferase)